MVRRQLVTDRDRNSLILLSQDGGIERCPIINQNEFITDWGPATLQIRHPSALIRPKFFDKGEKVTVTTSTEVSDLYEYVKLCRVVGLKACSKEVKASELEVGDEFIVDYFFGYYAAVNNNSMFIRLTKSSTKKLGEIEVDYEKYEYRVEIAEYKHKYTKIKYLPRSRRNPRS